MGPWLVWLARLAASRKFVTWLVKELGPGALDLYKRWITQLRHRQVAIDEADQIDGHFSAAIIDGNRHVVVWKNNQPVSAYPPLKHGDLSEKLRHHTRQDLQDPDELPTRRALRWVTSHVPGIGDHSEPDTKQLVAARDSKFPSGERRFHAAVKRTEPLLDDLQRAVRHCVSDHPVIPAVPGIYLFHYDGKPIYVGQSRNLRRRLSQHTAMGSRQNEASFAFLTWRSVRPVRLGSTWWAPARLSSQTQSSPSTSSGPAGKSPRWMFSSLHWRTRSSARCLRSTQRSPLGLRSSTASRLTSAAERAHQNI